MSAEDDAVKIARTGYAAGARDYWSLTSYVSERATGRVKLYAAIGAQRVISEETGKSKGQVVGPAVGVRPDQVEAPGIVSGIGDTVSALGDLPGVIRDTAELPTRMIRWLSDAGTWIRIAYVVGGGALILIAAGMVIANSGVTAAAAKAGKIVKGAK